MQERMPTSPSKRPIIHLMASWWHWTLWKYCGKDWQTSDTAQATAALGSTEQHRHHYRSWYPCHPWWCLWILSILMRLPPAVDALWCYLHGDSAAGWCWYARTFTILELHYGFFWSPEFQNFIVFSSKMERMLLINFGGT